MQIFVNGKACDVEEAATVAELLVQLAVRPAQVAVERNRELVPRTRHDQTVLVAGDQLEVVTLVGGG